MSSKKPSGAELERIEKATPAAFYHDDLAEVRAAYYFHEFIAQAARHGLQYLAEAAYHDMQEQGFSPPVVKALQELGGDRIAREQYLDFLCNRRFRQTLLCRSEVSLRGPLADSVRSFFISSRAKPASLAPSLEEGTLEEFTAPGDASVKISNGLMKAAVLHLTEIWPQAIAFDELLAAASSRIGAEATAAACADPAADLAETLLAMYAAPIVQFRNHPPRFTLELSERPVVSAVARWDLAKGANTITNLRHRFVRIDDPIAGQLTLLLDGTRDRDALARELAAFCRSRGLTFQFNGAAVADLPRLEQAIAAQLEENLRKVARMAVLVA